MTLDAFARSLDNRARYWRTLHQSWLDKGSRHTARRCLARAWELESMLELLRTVRPAAEVPHSDRDWSEDRTGVL